MRTSKKEKPQVLEPVPQVDIALPGVPVLPGLSATGRGAGESLSLEMSLAAHPDGDLASDRQGIEIVDILGSAVAESTGWRPPEAEDRER